MERHLSSFSLLPIGIPLLRMERDPFGAATMQRPWDHFTGMDLAKARVEAAFELFEKLNVPFFAFHDRDIAPEGLTLNETNKNLDIIVEMIKEYMKTSKTKLLWNTANMFTNPRFVHGAATSSTADVFAYAAAQVKKGFGNSKELRRRKLCILGRS